MLALFKGLVQEAYVECLTVPPPQGVASASGDGSTLVTATDPEALNVGSTKMRHGPVTWHGEPRFEDLVLTTPCPLH
jgi:hypothetical protein